MSGLDPVETFRQEAARAARDARAGACSTSEQQPGDGDLVNRAFRALHTLKGSGAMFGFTAVAAFIHDFETAFDRVRKGEATAVRRPRSPRRSHARDHVARLIERPRWPGTTAATPSSSALRAVVQGGGGGAAAAPAAQTSGSRSRPEPVRRRPAAGASASGCPRTR